MYEEKTVTAILTSMLERVPDTVDKREGSIIYDALAPAAVELSSAYTEMDYLLTQLYADTAEDEFLDRRAAERGLEREQATSAVVSALFNIEIEIGTRFYCGDQSYVTLELIGQTDDGYRYQLQCETAGADGNLHAGQLIPVEYVEGLTSAQITGLLTAGEDDEQDDSLRQRYMDSIGAVAFGGNIADYKQKVGELEGVGAVKVTPRAEPDDVIVITFLSSDNTPPTDEQIASVQEQVDPQSGSGVGIAPIGHVVIVQGAAESSITVALQLEYKDDGYTWDVVEPAITETVETYFSQLRDDWADNDTIIVRRSQIEARVLDIAGVQDVLKVTLNGEEANLTLDTDAVPILAEVTGE